MHACICMDKVVQTTLPAGTYTRLAEQARREGKPLKAVVREAIEEHLVKELPAWEDDPLQDFIGSLPGLTSGGPPRKPWKPDRLAKYRRKADQWRKTRGLSPGRGDGA